MGRSQNPSALASVPILACCSLGVGCAVLAAWKAPSLYAYGGALGALAGSAAALVASFRASGSLRAEIGRRSSLEAELEKQERRVKMQAEQLRSAMSTDEVTGALNRATFLERLDEALARDERLRRPLAVLYIDIEGFRELNRKHSRLGGDTVLRYVARVLQGVSRGTDYVGRLGGDEFAVILAECDDPAPVVDRLILGLDSPPPGESRLGRIAVSIAAVCVEEPLRGMDPSEIFREAEAALQSVRGKGQSLCAQRTLPRRAAARTSG